MLAAAVFGMPSVSQRKIEIPEAACMILSQIRVVRDSKKPANSAFYIFSPWLNREIGAAHGFILQSVAGSRISGMSVRHVTWRLARIFNEFGFNRRNGILTLR
jgi:hypothetical protein